MAFLHKNCFKSKQICTVITHDFKTRREGIFSFAGLLSRKLLKKCSIFDIVIPENY